MLNRLSHPGTPTLHHLYHDSCVSRSAFCFCPAVLLIWKLPCNFSTYFSYHFRSCVYQPEFLVVSNENRVWPSQTGKEVCRRATGKPIELAGRLKNWAMGKSRHNGDHTVRPMLQLGHRTEGMPCHLACMAMGCPSSFCCCPGNRRHTPGVEGCCVHCQRKLLLPLFLCVTT